MTDTLIDPAAMPEDEDAPDIAADDAGASGAAERAGKQSDESVPKDREGMQGEGV